MQNSALLDRKRREQVVLDLHLIQEDPMWCFYTLSGERSDVLFTSVNGIDRCVGTL